MDAKTVAIVSRLIRVLLCLFSPLNYTDLVPTTNHACV